MAKKEKPVAGATETQTAAPAATGNTVVMSDGKEVKFRAKSRLAVDLEDTGSTIELRVNVLNGQFVTYSHPIPTDLSDMSKRFLAHGLDAKFRDVAAGVTEPEEILQAVTDLKTAIESGNWSRVKESDGQSAKDNSQLFRILCLAYDGKRTPEEIRAHLATMSTEDKRTLRGHESLAPFAAKIKAEDARAKAEKLAAAAADKSAELPVLL